MKIAHFITILAITAFAAPVVEAQNILDLPIPSLVVPHTITMPAGTASPDDPAWVDAAVIPNLTLSVNCDANARVYPTRVQALWDKDYLYFRFTCIDDEIYVPYGSQRGANQYEGDVAEVFLDPVGDGRQYLELEVNPDNGVLDILWLATASIISSPDGRIEGPIIDRNLWDFRSWDLPFLETAASIQGTAKTPTGWIVDIAIPAQGILKRLGLRHYEPMTLRANFLRYEWTLPVDQYGKRGFAPYNWSPVSCGSPHVSPARMGFLHLVDQRETPSLDPK